MHPSVRVPRRAKLLSRTSPCAPRFRTLARRGPTAHVRSRGKSARALQRTPGARARRWVLDWTHGAMNRAGAGCSCAGSKKASNIQRARSTSRVRTSPSPKRGYSNGSQRCRTRRLPDGGKRLRRPALGGPVQLPHALARERRIVRALIISAATYGIRSCSFAPRPARPCSNRSRRCHTASVFLSPSPSCTVASHCVARRGCPSFASAYTKPSTLAGWIDGR